MMSTVRRRHLMVLPGGLVVGHLAASVLTGHQPAAELGEWGSILLQALLCVGLPLAGWAGLAAARDGWRGRATATGPLALIVQQVLAFVGLDLIEHALTGTDPWSAAQSGRFWVAVAAHAAAGALAWVVLRLASRLGRTLARLRRGRCEAWAAVPADLVARAMAAQIVALSSLSRRGPPVDVPAPHLI
ncbi:hypothetical protein HC251_24750 (plasmid) [Iamia sp. SCSIO 61187]|uniref:hypothetical protein n=1 Tax=Iamia sp. SCSIO 61187 TaxID=2722752 RepID=UPI001C62F077|nr:hypothetical protein [Iamia sp. SCSIO 61187]QYG94343.1 hypothetical protein HC251_19170 [Iamia sp. SCSIO 61187]QYG95764.1 hypothetical protein HC251_24750 [Iamia sp. SCSIO 61187]